MNLKWRNVGLIFHREVRDQLRDRRTLFMILILPLLLYPALGVGMVQLTLLFTEQTRTVVILGDQSLPPPPLVEGNRFVSSWFRNPENASKLEVITESEEAGPTPLDHRKTLFLSEAHALQKKLAERQQMEQQLHKVKTTGTKPQIAEAQAKCDALQVELGKLFSTSHIQVLVIVPEKFRENVSQVNELISKGQPADKAQDYPRPIILHNDADEKSLIAFNRVREAMRRWEQAILSHRLREAHLPESFPEPVSPIVENLALENQISSNLWSKLFPTLLVLMSITGAFYPAIDLGAGEKERGTMETLLICPASRTEIVLGKFLTVFSFSVCTAVLNLASMGFTSSHIMNVTGKLGQNASMTPPDLGTIAITIVLLIPLASLFSALCLSFATFARSTKEGQYYLTPLLMVTLGLTMFCLSPGVELTPFYSIIPVVGVALLLKGLLLHSVTGGGLYIYALPVLVTTAGYSLLALWWAIDQFRREEVLFREAERFDLRLWVKHLLRDKEPLPSSAEALFCFLLIMLLQFSISPGSLPSVNDMLQFVITQQLTMIACPALFMALILTTNFRKTLRLNPTSIASLVLAMLLACTLHPLTVELSDSLSWFFPKLPESVTKFLGSMFDPNRPLWMPIVGLALTPAICEEIAFRGFILSGFSRSGRIGLGIVFSALTFGAMHMIPQQVFNAALLGLVLGLIAVRTNSLFPGIFFHFVYNSLAIMHGKFGTTFAKTKIISPFFDVTDEGKLHYSVITLSLCAIVGGVILRHFVLLRPDNLPSSEPDDRDISESPEVPTKALSA
ncbi:MAG: ABC transporter permease subunit/CPBP intramembrane protease [Planctomycetales bacterium]